MEARELMTGDYAIVNKDVCIKKNTIVKIHAIDAENALPECGLKGCATCVPIDEPDGMSGGVWFDYLSPIPLTSELLERNGFERVPQPGCANPYHWMLEKYEEETDGLLFRIKAFNTPFSGMFVSIDNPSACETISFGKQIEFVHELQHALRLCEIELEIKLED